MEGRALGKSTIRKRGCVYCTDYYIEKVEGKKFKRCKHISGCPYHELDKYDTYEDYLESEDCQIKNFPDLSYLKN